MSAGRAGRRKTIGAALLAAGLVAGCGKKGPPLPPLLRVPRAPLDLTVERRGSEVKVQFTVPSTNTDGSRPANVARIEVYRYTGPSRATNEQLLKFGTRVATVAVKAPLNPDNATEEDEPEEQPELEQEGLDQGAVAKVEDELDPSAYEEAKLPEIKQPKRVVKEPDEGPLVTPVFPQASTTYVAVGFNKRGRKGPLSRRIAVPLMPPPKPPSSPTITYDETKVTLTWTSDAPVELVQEPPSEDELPARFIGFPVPTIGFHVYDVSPMSESGNGAAAADAGTESRAATDTGGKAETSADTNASGNGEISATGPVRLTASPVPKAEYEDTRMDWGKTRCYTVRTVEILSGLKIESDAAPPECTTLEDTFPPAAPKDLKAVATERAISLIWEANSEKDLAGYFVLRGAWPGQTLDRITAAPIAETSFSDTTVPSGMRYVYVVQAVDKAGNVGPMSNRAEETAR